MAIDHCLTYSSLIRKNDQILLVLQGYTSNSEDYYIKSFVECLVDDFELKVMHMRGIGIKLSTPEMMFWDSFKDLEEYLQLLGNLYPYKKIYFVGFSFGGMLLAGYQSTRGEEEKMSRRIS
jgi:predicted alpha/beta-fold hydrolase